MVCMDYTDLHDNQIDDETLFVGTGTTLEVTSQDGDRHVKLTGYKEVIRSLSLPDDFLASDKLEKHGGGYLTVNMREETYISRCDNASFHGMPDAIPKEGSPDLSFFWYNGHITISPSG